MTSGKNTKRAMLASALSLALCCAMLLGTTFAWFTDSVVNTGNVITAGRLEIGLNGGDTKPMFTSDENFWWEPGRSQKATATVTNEGSLWLKYTMRFDDVVTTGGTIDPDADITKVLDVYTVVENAADLAGAAYLGTMSDLMKAGSFAAKDAVLAPKGQADDTDTFTLVIKMQESAGNEYQGAGVSFNVNIIATQYTHEEDGFGSNQYDAAASYAWSGGTDDEGLEGNTDAQAKAVSIETPEQMASFAAAVNAGNTYKDYTVTLEKDLDLGGENWTPIGRSGHTFQGVFDGNGHTVSNLKVDMASSSDVGFFGFTQGGEIRNLTIHNAQVKGYLDVGVVAGTPYTSAYSNIKLTGTIQVDGYAYVGGMFGKNAYADLSDLTIDAVEGSYVKAESEGYRTYVGGVVGFMGEGRQSVSNVVSNIDVYGSTCDVGGITGIAHYGNTFANCISTGDVYLTNSIFDENKLEIGGIAGTWMNSSDGSVTLRGCSFTGTLHAVHNEQDISGEVAGNTLTGSKYYPDSNEGQLIIE